MNAAKLWRRILNGLACGTITGLDDTGPVLRAQTQIGTMETLDKVPVVQEFGFASCPPNGADIALTFIGGDRSSGMGVGTNHQATRFKNKQPGETVVYNAFGMSIYLSNQGIVINAGGKPVLFRGDLHCTGQVIQGFGTAGQVGLLTHEHPANNTPPTPGS